MADVQLASDFKDVVQRNLVQQAKFFLRRYANQFKGNFNEILVGIALHCRPEFAGGSDVSFLFLFLYVHDPSGSLDDRQLD